MWINLLWTFAVLMALLFGWIKVQSAARRVALERPETGPFRLVGGGCGGHGHGDASDHASSNPGRSIPIAIADRITPDSNDDSGGCSTCGNTGCKALGSTCN